MALSGTLKNPARSLRIGNPTSLIFVFVTYCLLAITSFYYFSPTELKTDPFLFMKISWPQGVVTIGICAATISSALGAILGGPRILQSLSQDQVTPKIFSRTYGPLKEPRYAIGLTFLLTLFLILSTNIDQIIPIYTMICLINYGLLNLTAFISNHINAPSWRPDFKVPKYIPLLGFTLCVFFMFMINAEWGFIALTSILLIYTILNRTEASNQILGIKRSIWFWLMRKGLYHLEESSDDIVTWHPSLLVLSISPNTYPRMVKFSKNLTDDNGLLTFGVVLPTTWDSPDRISWNKKALISHFKEQKVNCLVATHVSDSPYQGFINLVKTHGTALMEPNSILVPITSPNDITPEFLDLVKACYSTQKNLLLYFPDQLEKLETPLADKPGSKRVIDLWWNSKDRSSTDLMLNYIEIFYESRAWKRSKVYLNALAGSKAEKENLNDFLKRLVKLNKLKIKVRVYKNNKDYSAAENISHRSDKEDITFQVLPSYTGEENDSAYIRKIKTILKRSQKMNSDCLFISKYDTINHGDLLK